MAEEKNQPTDDNPVEEAVEEVVDTVEEVAVEAEVGVEMLAEDAEEAVDSLADDAEDVAEDLEAQAESNEFMVVADALVDAHGDDHHEPHYTDEVVLPYFGHIGTMPGGIYTFIFGVLGVITVVEVLFTEILPDNVFTISLLVILSLAKAYLVVMYYMHLNNDNPIFRVVILLPLLVVIVSVLYLLGVPAGAGLGYN